jgi:hypothetical protein
MCARILLSCFLEVYAPPTAYADIPTPKYELVFLSPDKMQEGCWNRPGEWSWACVPPTYKRKIYVRDELRGHEKELAVIVAHEEAHLKGWKHAKSLGL